MSAPTSDNSTPITQEFLDALDATAKSLGPTPRYDSANRVVPFGSPHRNGRVYVVWHGRAIGLFYGMMLADAMVWAFYGAAYVACRNLEEAQQMFRRGPSVLRGLWVPPEPRAAIPTPGVARPDVSEGNYKAEELAYDERALFRGDLSDIRAQLHAPPSIPIIQDHQAREAARRRWESMEEQGNGSFYPQPTPAPQAPSISGLSALSSGTASWGIVNTPAISSWDTTTASSSTTAQPTNPVIHERNVVAWAVIRGLHPGVYQTRRDADLASGYAVGIKVVAFTHKTPAFVYFVQKYMAGMVGCPVDVEE